jgi:prefoldin subunit 5
MGCGESTGKDDTNMAIEFKKTDCKTVDEFFDKAQEILESMTSLEGGLQDAKDAFYQQTGFEFAPGASKIQFYFIEPKQAFLGMYLCLASNVNGDIDSLKVEFKDESPFASVDISSLDGPVQAVWKSFEDYVKALEEMVNKLPDIFEQAEALVDESDKLQKNAEPEFEKLGTMDKVKAVAYTGKNITQLPKLPKGIKSSL